MRSDPSSLPAGKLHRCDFEFHFDALKASRIEVQTPSNRNGTFEPKIIEKGRRDSKASTINPVDVRAPDVRHLAAVATEFGIRVMTPGDAWKEVKRFL